MKPEKKTFMQPRKETIAPRDESEAFDPEQSGSRREPYHAGCAAYSFVDTVCWNAWEVKATVLDHFYLWVENTRCAFDSKKSCERYVRAFVDMLEEESVKMDNPNGFVRWALAKPEVAEKNHASCFTNL